MGILESFRLDGQVAVVTGAGKGIGRAIAIGLAEAGADVAVASRTQADLDAVAALRHSWGVFRDRRPELYEPIVRLDGAD